MSAKLEILLERRPRKKAISHCRILHYELHVSASVVLNLSTHLLSLLHVGRELVQLVEDARLSDGRRLCRRREA